MKNKDNNHAQETNKAKTKAKFSASKKVQMYIKAISFLSVLVIGLTAFGILNSIYANNYKLKVEVYAQQSMSELCESLDNITVNLQKTLYVNSSQMLTSLASELYKESSLAKSNLSQLTSSELESSEIYKFLSQVGSFVFSLTENEDFELTDQNRADLLALYTYSLSLSNELSTTMSEVFNGEVSWEEELSTLTLTSSQLPESFLSSMSDAAQSLTDYPTLIYDGPFADSILEKDALMLQDEEEITLEEAKEIAAEILGTSTSGLRQDSDSDGTIAMYCFSVGEHYVAITKLGGYVAYLLSSDYAGEITISELEAIDLAKTYLDNLGYTDMVESYYYDYDGICTINFAYQQDDITYYSDLIKVSVRLDTGEITSIDAHGYLMNHSEREIASEILSEDEVTAKISTSLEIMSISQVMIPKDTGKEVYCYEVHAKDSEGQEVLIYLDAVDGSEEDVLMLLYSDDGTLTR
ncbi:MAG: germination protein YpeB [Clostridia bacterium]